MRRCKYLLVPALSFCGSLLAQRVELAPVVSKHVSQVIDLPGEFQAFESVAIHAKIRSFVEQMLVDRGSVVKRGQILATLSAPEMKAQIAEALSKVQVSESEKVQADAQLLAAKSTFDRLRKASETEGAVSGNELELAQEQVKAAEANVQARQQAKAAAEQAVNAQQDLESYLKIAAPFSGIVTERMVHPGALVGPTADPVMLVLAEVARLRLVVSVPEQDTGGAVKGTAVEFHVPAYPQRKYSAPVARMAHALDPKTRTMAVELDVLNRDGSLSPGMYPSVKWPVQRSQASLMVPKTAVVTTTERTFVVRRENGKAGWVNVSKGVVDGDFVEVSGNLRAGEMVVRRATDEIREGSSLENK